MVAHFVNDVNTRQVIMGQVHIHIRGLVMEQEAIFHQVVTVVDILIVQVLSMVRVSMVLAQDNMVNMVNMVLAWDNTVNMVLVRDNMVLARDNTAVSMVNMVLARDNTAVNMDNIRTVATVVSDLVILSLFSVLIQHRLFSSIWL